MSIKISFIGIGAAKSGTTWITDCLREHPEIGYPYINELNYFSKTRAGNTKSEYDFRGVQGYLDIFKDCSGKGVKVCGEFSTHYLPDKQTAAIIKKHFPKIKILVVLRQPVERAYSDYLNRMLISKTEQRSFEQAFRTRSKSYYDDYIWKGLYYEQLKPYLKEFSKKQIKIVLFDDLKKEPVKTIQDIYKFIGVDAGFVPKAATRVSNVSSGVQSGSFMKIMTSVSKIVHLLERAGFVKIISTIKRKTRLNQLYWKIIESRRRPIKKQKLDIELRKKLTKEFFEKDIKQLEKILKRNLDVWLN